MKLKRWLALLPAMLLGVSSLLIARTADRDAEEDKPGFGATADMSTAPRVDVDRPKPIFPLYQRDKRVHGLQPFQELVDAMPAGSTLRPPPGNYSGPVVMTKPLTIDGGGQVTIDAGDQRHGVLAGNQRRGAARTASDRLRRLARHRRLLPRRARPAAT